ncbi:MAG: exodeoxyribonuclease VII large subunit [Candidatus Curtissbacteria bacterium]|nr:exodeoxyribonuclease VII large subunit [Candidatus Curtissbacteria bacterium]
MKTDKDRKIYSVSEVNYFAKETLEQMELWVEGEVTTFKENPNWRFFYLDLKDDNALLPCVADGSIFKDFGGSELVGQKILAFGFLSLYEPRGQYQFKIKKVEAIGEGVLAKKLEELIKKLKGEGLFDQQHKKEIPLYPKKVCVVTSAGSDAWNDFKRHTTDKFPIIDLATADVRVQGIKSIPQLLAILPKVDREGFDVVVITRGGGSLEDLAAFNDEAVARAIFKMKTPTVVAIGHEANESLAEWVADRRASTPTDAANIVTNGYLLIIDKLESIGTRLKIRADYFFSANFQKLDYNFRQLLQVKSYFKDLPHRLTIIAQAFAHQQKYLITDASTKLENLAKSLRILSPENTLSRGYSITTDSRGRIVKSIEGVVLGDIIGVKLARGSLTSQVQSKNK